MTTLQTARAVVGALVAAASAGAVAPWHPRELGHSPQSVWDTAQTFPVSDSTRFRASWSRLYPIAALRPALPVVDFAKWRVIVVAAGTKPTGGYSLTLDSGRVARDTALMALTLHTPPRGCAVTQELTTPAVAIATPALPVPYQIIIRERADSVRCD